MLSCCRAKFLLLLFLVWQLASGFKEHEFKKCDDANFCKRNRAVKKQQYAIDPSTVDTKDAKRISAIITNTGNKARFKLVIAAYSGITRFFIDEDPSNGRYQVPDILMAGLESSTQDWEIKRSDKNGLTALNGASTVFVLYSPLRITLQVNGVRALEFNSNDMFAFEHRRSKQEGDPEGWWEESFKGHTDNKPKGPEAISLDVKFPEFKHLYGIPEHATSMALKPTAGVSEPYRLYNLDVFEYLDESPFGLYGSIPLLVAHKAGLTVGLFWLNAAEMFVDVAKQSDGLSAQWIAESGIVDLFVLEGPSPADVLRQYALLTGSTAMPQLFALGYHQCRWNYRDEDDVYQVDGGFDQHMIPYDVLWLDIEHTDGKRYMTWDTRYFPHPVEMQEALASRGRKMVTIVDPHVKRDSGYGVHAEAEKLGLYVKNRDGGDFDGWCWPGSSSYLDVTSPTVRAWWVDRFSLDQYQGSTKYLYIWNDMNEPSVFNGPEITMHKDNLHEGGVEHRDLHNIYGYYYHLATAEGLIKRGYEVHGKDGDRPFVLSRAFYAGTQRVGPIWTGDNTASWSHLRVSVPMLLTLGITGLPFSGADVGGFFGNPDVELLTRWYQLGIYYPFFRGHAHLEAARREPWLFGEEPTRRIREAVRTRYSLLPYIYTLFRHANLTGQPVMRPLWFEFPKNEGVFSTDDEFLLGPGLLVKPISQSETHHTDVLLPRDSLWYDAKTGALMEKSTWVPSLDQTHRVKVDMEAIPAFYRGGVIIPRRDRARRSTEAMATDPFTLVVALDHSGAARGDLYVDDGHSFAFARGQYLHREFSYSNGRLTARAFADGLSHSGVVPPTTSLVIERIIVLGLPEKDWGAKLVEGGTGEYQVFEGPADMRAGAGGSAYIVRKPDLPLGTDWTLELYEKVQ